jgi:hypothetical protein
MAVNWMDNFNIYGQDGGATARMLNGVYAEVAGIVALVADPDPSVLGGLRALKLTGNNDTIVRKVLPTARTTIGVAHRLWLSAIPAGSGQNHRIVGFRDVNNVQHGFLTIDASGNLLYYRSDIAGTVLLGQTATPVIVANAWKHIETKVVLDAAAGSVEVRVEGVPVITVAGVRTTTNTVGAVLSCMSVAFRNLDFLGPEQYYKDLIIWDNTTGFNNDFMGSCQVLKIIPDGDVALNWTPSSGLTGFNLINEVTPDDDANYISAPAPGIPAAYKCSLSDLPVTVTSVRSVMPIHRSRKTDGGDGNIQIGAISGASTGLGTDRPVTTAYTYWWDIFDTDPATAAAWSRISVNAMNLQINRTL